eukprot:g12479.t1
MVPGGPEVGSLSPQQQRFSFAAPGRSQGGSTSAVGTSGVVVGGGGQVQIQKSSFPQEPRLATVPSSNHPSKAAAAHLSTYCEVAAQEHSQGAGGATSSSKATPSLHSDGGSEDGAGAPGGGRLSPNRPATFCVPQAMSFGNADPLVAVVPNNYSIPHPQFEFSATYPSGSASNVGTAVSPSVAGTTRGIGSSRSRKQPRPHLLELSVHELSLNDLSVFPEKSMFVTSKYVVTARTLVAPQPLAQIRWTAAADKETADLRTRQPDRVLSDAFDHKKIEKHSESSSAGGVGGTRSAHSQSQLRNAPTPSSSSRIGFRHAKTRSSSPDDWEAIASTTGVYQNAESSSSSAGTVIRTASATAGTAALRDFSALDMKRATDEPDLVLLRPESRHEYLLVELWLFSESMTSSEHRLVGRLGLDLVPYLQGLAYTSQEVGHALFNREGDEIGRLHLHNLQYSSTADAIASDRIFSDFQSQTAIHLRWDETDQYNQQEHDHNFYDGKSAYCSGLPITSFTVFRKAPGGDRNTYEILADGVRGNKYEVKQGLVGNTEYQFLVTANNRCGVGAFPSMTASAPFTVRTAATAPAPVTALTLEVNANSNTGAHHSIDLPLVKNAALDVAFARPTSDGGSPILFYRLHMCKVANCTWWSDVFPDKNKRWTDMGSISAYDNEGRCQLFRCRVEPLEKSCRYAVRVFAVNAVGYSVASEEPKPVYV